MVDRAPFWPGAEAFRPREWFVVFQLHTRFRWLRWMPGRYKHVMAFAHVAEAGVWILVNVGWDRTELVVIDDADVKEILTDLLYGTDIVKVPAGGMPRKLPHFGFWCVPAIAHIVGVKSSALRPDAFLRDCLAHGGEFINGGSTGSGAEDQD